MRFWKLVSIFRSEPRALEQLLQDSAWSMYLDWFLNFKEHVNLQNRSVLDDELPLALVEKTMEVCNAKFNIEDGYLVQSSNEDCATLSAKVVYDRFGADAIESVLERGSVLVIETDTSTGNSLTR